MVAGSEPITGWPQAGMLMFECLCEVLGKLNAVCVGNAAERCLQAHQKGKGIQKEMRKEPT